MSETPTPPPQSPEGHLANARAAFAEAAEPVVEPVVLRLGELAATEAEKTANQAARGVGVGEEAERYLDLAASPIAAGAEQYLKRQEDGLKQQVDDLTCDPSAPPTLTANPRRGDLSGIGFSAFMKQFGIPKQTPEPQRSEYTPGRLAPSAPASEGPPPPLTGLQADVWRGMQQSPHK